jgi:uncharacterized membrane protein
MKAEEFLEAIDDSRIVAAIARAEQRTSGEIRLCITDLNRQDALAAARSRFEKLGMHKTKERNAVLIYLVPRTRVFAIVGDSGVHSRCGPEFWNAIAAAMAADLKQGRLTDAIVQAIDRVADLLARHFPPRPDDRNELPNEVERE